MLFPEQEYVHYSPFCACALLSAISKGTKDQSNYGSYSKKKQAYLVLSHDEVGWRRRGAKVSRWRCQSFFLISATWRKICIIGWMGDVTFLLCPLVMHTSDPPIPSSPNIVASFVFLSIWWPLRTLDNCNQGSGSIHSYSRDQRRSSSYSHHRDNSNRRANSRHRDNGPKAKPKCLVFSSLSPEAEPCLEPREMKKSCEHC